ncbi:efflux RND transporter permease subunit [Thiotrichales bacterium 19S3-7]|nr:efflux RND transporter permease subunit [Thiotrichales bacterium 19S3-7]MCF6802903.1 efflux RND transporter permease subunit [Thiotrichales bacterium 19S3-11]
MTEFFIKRPIFTSAIFLLLLLAGLFAYEKIELRQYPNISGSTIMIRTTYPGANADTMESMVTTPIETALQGIDGVDYMTSSSSSGVSAIVITLNVGADENTAVTQIETSLSSVKSQLPNGVNDPIIKEADASSIPDLMLSYSSQKLSSGAITDYLTRDLEPLLSNIAGVGEIQIMGNRTYAMRVWLNVYKMRAYGITAVDVANALSTENVQATPGDIDRNSQILIIDAKTDSHSAVDFQNLVIKQVANTVIRLGDISDVKLGASDTTTSMYTNGISSVGLAITYKSDANPITSAALVKDALSKIQLPSDLKVQIIRDSSTYINASLKEISETLVITIIVVMLIIVMFLGSIRLSIIPLTTIPLSLAGAILIMYFLGFSINLLTLLAFVLAIGLVVDDAIVVMENIHRHMLMGKEITIASVIGVKELVIAVIGITITLLAVFAPIGLNTGITGALFKEFAFTLAGAVLISGFVALFFTPMLCSKIISKKENRLSQAIEHFFDKVSIKYKALLKEIIDYRKSILFLIILILALGILSMSFLSGKSELAPSEDQGAIIGMAQGPSSASLQYTEKYTDRLAPIFKDYSAIDNSSVINGFPMGQYSSLIIIKLFDWSERNLSANQIIQSLNPKISSIPGVNVMLNSPAALPISKGTFNFQFVVKTMGSYNQLSQVVSEMTQNARSNPGIMNTQVDLHIDQPMTVITINKLKANYLGVSMSDIAETLSVAFGQPQSDEFVLDGYAYYIIPQVNDQQRANQNIINLLTVKTSSGEIIPLSTVISLNNKISSSTWGHFQGQRSATISAQLASGYSTEQALTYFEGLFNQYKKSNMEYDIAGETRSFVETQGSIGMLFGAALLVIFLVLAAQYESLKDPLIIMFTVPLAITSALLALYFSGYSLNIYTEIGLITLIGLITKHGILLVDFAKQYQKSNHSTVNEAIIQAASIRLKPVLMTTLAMVFGSVPLLLASGAGANSRNQLGMVIASGMLFGTFFTLIILPTIYSLVKNLSFSKVKRSKEI